MLGFLIALIVVGLVAGALARLLVPGRDSMGIPGTAVLGIAGSFLGGFLADVLFRDGGSDRGLHPAGLVGSVVGAILVLLLLRFMRRHQGARA